MRTSEYVLDKKDFDICTLNFKLENRSDVVAIQTYIELNSQVLDKLTDVVKVKYPHIKRGDMVILDQIREIEEYFGRFIFDGDKVITLDDETADLGAIPCEFKGISEFPIRYWNGSVYKNAYICINMDVLEGKYIQDNVYTIVEEFDYGNETWIIFKFEYLNETYYIITRDPEYKPETFLEDVKNSDGLFEWVLDGEHIPDDFDLDHVLIMGDR